MATVIQVHYQVGLISHKHGDSSLKETKTMEKANTFFSIIFFNKYIKNYLYYIFIIILSLEYLSSSTICGDTHKRNKGE